MKPTPYPDVNELLDDLLAEIRAILGPKLVGLYTFGSLATGAFEHETSDIDLVAALTTDLDQREFARLERMHAAIARRHPRWDDRVEVGYIAVAKLRRIAAEDEMARISPGEPFHDTEAGNGWLFNLSIMREHGLALTGPPPRSLIDPIRSEDLIDRLRPLMREWREWIAATEAMHRRDYQGYVIITMCRNLYLLAHRAIGSKQEATAWVEQAQPRWAPLIRDAHVWRQAGHDEGVDGDATLPQTLRFVNFVIDSILDESPKRD